jgi:stage III sporulation protein AF
MQAINSWAFSLCAALAASGLALQILPKSNLTSVFKLVVSMFFLCSLLMPIAIQLPLERYSLEAYSQREAGERAQELEALADKQAAALAGENLKKIIAAKLQQMGIKQHAITINIDVNGQSAQPASADITLDKAHEPAHGRISMTLREELGIEVRLGYA